jgi:hypothetical protein
MKDDLPSVWDARRLKGIPGFPEVSSWHVPPQPPLRIDAIDIYRDGGTGYLAVSDANGQIYPFCFDKFLGRLCVGKHPADDAAAYVTTGSVLEEDIFRLMKATLDDFTPRSHSTRDLRMDLLRKFFERAKVHSGWGED